MVLAILAKPVKIPTIQVSIAKENVAKWITVIIVLTTQMCAHTALTALDQTKAIAVRNAVLDAGLVHRMRNYAKTVMGI